jgi:hypothetical protein
LHRLDCLGSHGRLDVYEMLVRERAELERRPELVPPLLTGRDLLALGMRPGPELGRLLCQLREKQLAEELTTRDQALAWVREQLGAVAPGRAESGAAAPGREGADPSAAPVTTPGPGSTPAAGSTGAGDR